MAVALVQSALPQLDRVSVPTYDRSALRTGVVHFGIGGFHRAHEAMYVDALMNQGSALDWGIVGVGLMPGDARMRDALAAQDNLYTLVVKHPDGRLEPRVIGSITEYLYAPDDPEAVVEKMADPGTRIVSLTVTEGGYSTDPVTGEFAPGPAVLADLDAYADEMILVIARRLGFADAYERVVDALDRP